jgi:adenine-specific DNA-methyltransferase
MSAGAPRYRPKTLPGLARAFRRWAETVEPEVLVEVPGASAAERHLLSLLGGVAASIAGDLVANWQYGIRGWAESAPTPPEDILDAARLALGLGDDPLAALYNASISATNRRRLGTVFSPPALVEHMFRLTTAELREDPVLIVDPGAGVGAFTIAAAQTWPSATVVAVDINPVTLGLLGARLAFEADIDPERASLYHRVELRLANYLDELEGFFPSQRSGPTVVLGNPPYTRVQELPADDREKSARLAGDLIDSGHANLAMLFQAATLRHMRPDDVSCMVLPGSLSYTRASRALRAALWKSSRSVTIHRTPAADKAFIGRSVQAAVLLIGSERQRRPKLKLARVQLNESSVDILEAWKLTRTKPQPDNWFLSDDVAAADGQPVLLGDIATVRRGVATGANEVFFLPDAVRKTLPDEVSVPAIPTLRHFDGEELSEAAHSGLVDSDTRRWLLAIPPDYELSGALAAYVEQHGEVVSGRHLARQRACWYSITDLPRPQILVSPLSKVNFKIVLNAVGAVPSNNLFGISLNDG